MTRTDDPLQTTRDLLDRQASLRHGFLDVLGESVASETPTLAQAAMNSSLVATVYERLWRPVAFYVAEKRGRPYHGGRRGNDEREGRGRHKEHGPHHDQHDNHDHHGNHDNHD